MTYVLHGRTDLSYMCVDRVRLKANTRFLRESDFVNRLHVNRRTILRE